MVAASTRHPNSVFPFIYPTPKTQTCECMRFRIYKSHEARSSNKDMKERQETAGAILALTVPPLSMNCTYCGSYSYSLAILEDDLTTFSLAGTI